MIRRGKSVRNYTHISNDVFNSNLSAECVGVLCYLVSKPPEWEVKIENLSDVFNCGVKKMYSIMRELRVAGFAVMHKKANGSVDYEVSDEKPDGQKGDQATSSLMPKKANSQIGCQPKGPSIVRTEKKKEITEREEDKESNARDAQADFDLSPPPLPAKSIEPFEKFWSAFPKRTGTNPKGAAKTKFDRLRKTIDPEIIIAGAIRYAEAVRGNDPQFTKMATTWLNQRGWEDEYRFRQIGSQERAFATSGSRSPLSDPVTAAVGRVVSRRLAEINGAGPPVDLENSRIPFPK